jgi:hypothetical protein
MLAIDLTLLIGLCVLRPRGRRLPPAELGRKVGYVMFVPVLLGVGIGFGVPDRAAVTLEVVDTATPVVTTPEVATPEVTATIAWPPMPATAKPWYAPEFESWKDQRLDAQELMLLVQRPLPANLNVGRHHIVFMRDDCDHCHELLNSYFSGPLTTPTTSISIPDATGELLENPCSECGKATLPKGINYVLSTPVLLTVEDGVVVGVCMNSEDATLVRAALNAKGKVTP